MKNTLKSRAPLHLSRSVLGALLLGLGALSTGCGLTCELDGVTNDYADCASAESALAGTELTGGEKKDLRECLVDACEGFSEPEASTQE